RPYGFEEVLKKTFEQCRMYGLKPFSEKDILISIHNFLKNKLDGYEHYFEYHQIDIIKTLFRIFKYVLEDIRYGSIPLLLYMVQIILLSEIKMRVNEIAHTISYQMLDEKKFDILYLVEEFVGRKMKNLFTDKKGATDSAANVPAAKKFEDRLKKEIKEQHFLLALYVLFDKNDLEQLLSRKERKCAIEIMEEVNQGDEKTGIVLGVQNGVPQFQHRTFAEYFTACWLFENRERFKDESIFHSQTICSDSLRQSLGFFDRLILRESKDCHLHLALVNRSDTQVEKILLNNPSAVTVPDMIICKENNNADQLCGWTGLDYAFVLNKKKVIKLLFKSGVKPNMDNLLKQVCSNSLNVLLEMACKYSNTFVELLNRKDLAEELSERVAKILIEEKKVDIYAPHAELNSFSVLEKVISERSVSMFRQLITKSNPQKLGLYDNAERLLKSSLETGCYAITNYIVEYHPHLFRIIIDQGKLLQCIQSAIENNQLELFKQFFHESCVEKEIECIEDGNIFDDINEQDENETLGIEIPFKDDCCENDWLFRFELKSNAESILYLAIYYGNKEMISYILQKTNIKVTVKLLENFMNQSRTIRKINHEKCIPVFKFLFKQALAKHDADQVGMNLFFTIINCGCVYMLHSLFDIGFVPNNIMDHLNVFQHMYMLGYKRLANILVYLQQQCDLDCFDRFDSTGRSIFDFAIEKKRFIVTQTLIEVKVGNLSNSEKENAILDLLHQQILKFGREAIFEFIKSLLFESSLG
uniref:Uncharacterized protein n=1 Tax=Anopheles funestus TaxID=62324 RepID=A0A182RP21_ANOFN